MQPASERQLNSGLLLIRLGLAFTLLTYAVPRLVAGAPTWIEVGRDLRFFQSEFPTRIVGLVLLVIQVLGSLGLITGGFFRISTALIAIVYGLHFLDFMSVGYKTLPLYAAALTFVCIGLMITGPGRYSVAVKIEPKL